MECIFSKRLKEERLKKNYTQQQLADLVNKERKEYDGKDIKISRVSINRYENGKRTPDYGTLNLIAFVLDTDIEYLLGRSDKKHLSYVNEPVNDFIKYITEVAEKDNLNINNCLFSLITDFQDIIESGIENNILDKINDLFSIFVGIIDYSVNNKNPEVLDKFKKLLGLFCKYYKSDEDLKLQVEHLEELKKIEQDVIESNKVFKESKYFKLLQSIELHGSSDEKVKYQDFLANHKKHEEDSKKQIDEIEKKQKKLEQQIAELKKNKNNINSILFSD